MTCFPPVVEELKEVEGVFDVVVDKHKVEASVTIAPKVPAKALLAAVRRGGAKIHENIEATIGAGKGSYVPLPGFPADKDVALLVKDGQDVPDLGAEAVPGKVTVFDFFAEWCGPCRRVDEHMRGVLAFRNDVAYRKLNVYDWDTPLAKRYLAKVPDLPYVVVYGKDRERVTEISGLNTAAIDAAVAKAGNRRWKP